MAKFGLPQMPSLGRSRRRAYEVRPGAAAPAASPRPRSLEIWKEAGAPPRFVATSASKDKAFAAELGGGAVRLAQAMPELIGGGEGDLLGFYADMPTESCYAPIWGEIPGVLGTALPSLPSGRNDAAWIQALYVALPSDISRTAADAYADLGRSAGSGSLEASAAAKLSPYRAPGSYGALAGLAVMGAIRSDDAESRIEALAGAFGAIVAGRDGLSASPYQPELVLPRLESRDFDFSEAAYVLGLVTGTIQSEQIRDPARARIPFMAVTPAELESLLRVPDARAPRSGEA